MPKILQRFPEASVVDAFAGPGIYEDGLDGSPLLIARAYLDHRASARFGRLTVYCLEQRADRVAVLNEQVGRLGLRPGDPLQIKVLDPGVFVEQQQRLSALAHAGDPQRPVLWLLDPFKIKSLPFSAVQACLVGQRDEVIVTLFVEEMHRFFTLPQLPRLLDEHFGGSAWTPAIWQPTESARKQALVDAYCGQLQHDRLLTGRFGVQVRNATARYYLVFATHSQYGLDCWTPVGWRLDRYAGQKASASSVHQLDIFGTSHTGPLRKALEARAGQELAWAALHAEVTRLGFMDKHLRSALDELATDGLAFRVQPTVARSSWPDGCVVRFYTPEDAAEDIDAEDTEVFDP
jgi:three-Cys-motif partner protein